MKKNISFKRAVDPMVMLKLSTLVCNANLNSPIIAFDKFFIDFVNGSYQVKPCFRPSISQLANFFEKHGCERPAYLAHLYAVMLEQIASENNDFQFAI